MEMMDYTEIDPDIFRQKRAGEFAPALSLRPEIPVKSGVYGVGTGVLQSRP